MQSQFLYIDNRRKEGKNEKINIFISRYLTATDYFAAAGYRTALAGTYYPSEYHAALQNGYLDPSTRIPGLASYDQVSVSLTVIIMSCVTALSFAETVRCRQTVQLQCRGLHV